MSRYEPITERDIETPVEDLTEQGRSVGPDDEADEPAPSEDPEVDEADAAEQRIEVRLTDDDEYRG